MDDKKRIIERIKKMLALSKDAGASEGERDNALRMAHATIAKYNLSLEEVEAAQGPTEKRINEYTQFFGRPWARQICVAVGQLLFCKYYYQIPSSTRSATKVMHHYVGRESNVVSAAELAKFLVNSILSERKRRKRQMSDYDPDASLQAWERSFAWGASHAIYERVQAIMEGRDESQKGTGKSLVLASLYKTEAEKNAVALKEMGITLKTSNSFGQRSRNLDGLGEGKLYGKSLSLGRQVTQGKQGRLE